MSMCHRISWTISLAMLFAFGLVGCNEKKGGTTGGAADSRTTLEGVEGCEGAILPDAKTIETGTYKPLSRPLFIYVNSKALQKPEVAGYVKTLLNQAQEQVEHAGFVKLNPTVLKAQQDKLAAAIGKLGIPEKVEGTISVDGSSTVQPFSTIAAEIFEKANDKKVRVQVGSKGTGGGMERFCVGETDICNASRIMKPSEAAKAKSNGIEYTEFTICIDGISVCVSKKNDWCDCLSVEQLKALWEPESRN
jgi:phosphate transport system substrate-binding protein